MREILFRGKPIDSVGFIEGAYYHQTEFYGDECDYHYIITTKDELEDNMMCFSVVIPETVGQYTGLTDKNGTKIFEGDIFKFPDEVFESYYTSCGTEYNSWEVENYGVVGFFEHLSRFDFVEYKFNENSVEADLHENNDLDFAEFVSELEVIGNIHDNPELLKGGDTE